MSDDAGKARGHLKGLGSAAGDVGASFLGSSGSAGVLGTAISAIPFGPIAGAAVGLAAVIWKLRDSESAAEVQARRLAAAHDAVRTAVEGARAASVGQTQASVTLMQAQNAHTVAVQKLRDAQTNLAAVARTSGRDSLAYRDALLAVRQAQVAAATATQNLGTAQRGSLSASQRAADSIDGEIKSLRDRRKVLEESIIGARAFGVSAKDLAANERALSDVTQQLASKTAASADKHRQAAAKAREMAAAVEGATPKAQALRDRLNDLAKQEIDKANKIDALNSIGSAASGAAGKVGNLVTQIRLANAIRFAPPGIGSAPADRQGSPTTKSTNARRPKGSPSTALSVALAGLTPGPQNTNLIAALIAQEGAAQGTLAAAQKAVEGIPSLRTSLKNAKTPAERLRFLEAIRNREQRAIDAANSLQAVREQIASLDQANTDAVLAAKQEIVQAAAEAAAAEAQAAAESEDNRRAGFDAMIALAALTADTADDLVAAKAKEAELAAELQAAQVEGNNALIAQLAGALLGVRNDIAQQTAKPASQGGQGQPFNELTLNIYPTGAAATDSRALAAAISREFRVATA
jgi:SWI/SNF-related matrix-associated actin-dependent regulator 1 of chromatin subfamily A